MALFPIASVADICRRSHKILSCVTFFKCMHVGSLLPILFNGKLIVCHIGSAYKSFSSALWNELQRLFSHFKWETKFQGAYMFGLKTLRTSLHMRCKWKVTKLPVIHCTPSLYYKLPKSVIFKWKCIAF